MTEKSLLVGGTGDEIETCDARLDDGQVERDGGFEKCFEIRRDALKLPAEKVAGRAALGVEIDGEHTFAGADGEQRKHERRRGFSHAALAVPDGETDGAAGGGCSANHVSRGTLPSSLAVRQGPSSHPINRQRRSASCR